MPPLLTKCDYLELPIGSDDKSDGWSLAHQYPHYIRKITFEFLHLIVSFCIFSHLIANIRSDKIEPTYCMSYHIKNKAENDIIKYFILSSLSEKVLRCNKMQ